MDSTLAYSGDLEVDWEDNIDEVITIENDSVPRYCKISEVVDILTRDGESMNFLFLSIVLVCLPSISSPSELCSELLRKFTDPKTLELPVSKREQIQLKIMVMLRAWARSSSVYCDFSGPVIESALDVAKEGINSDYAPVIAAGRKVKAALKIIRDDLRDIEKAQMIFQNRVSKMRSVFASNQTPAKSSKSSESSDFSSPVRKANASDHEVWELGKIIDVNSASNNNNNSNSNSSNIASNNRNNSSSSSNNDNSGNISNGARYETLSFSYSANNVMDQPLPSSFAFLLETAPAQDDRALSDESIMSSISFASVNLSRESPSSPYLTDDLNADNVFTGIDIDTEVVSSSASVSGAPNISINIRNSLFEDEGEIRKVGVRDSVNSPQYSPKSPNKSPKRKMKPKLSIIQSMPFEELANFLTIYEFEDYLLSVRPREFVGMAWTKKDLKSVHPDLGGSANLSRTIFYTNQTIAWVAREIIDYSAFFGPTAEGIEYFIRAAKSVLDKNNFNTFFHIVSALGLPAIRQLKAGWTHVATKKKLLFKQYLEICSSHGNYSNYRKLLSKAQGLPHIPSIQVLIKDIVFLETSGPWRSGGIIDMKKAVSMHALIGSYVHIENGISQLLPYEVNIKNLGIVTPTPTPTHAIPPTSTLSPKPSPKIATGGRSLFSPDDPSLVMPPSFTPSNSSRAGGSNNGSNADDNSIASDNNQFTSPKSPMRGNRERSGTIDFFSSVTLSTPSFIYNLRVARDSFFGPLHEDYLNFDSNQRYSILTPELNINPSLKTSPSPNPSLSPIRSPSSPFTRNVSSKTKIINFFKRLVGAEITNEFALIGDDVNLAILQSHLSSINPDLNLLWQDAKYADKVETRRLVGKLASAGLY